MNGYQIFVVFGRTDHQEQDFDEVIRIKKEGTEAHREYRAWLMRGSLAFNISN